MEYMVIMYNTLTKTEEYEYFSNKNDSIKYAKDMVDENTITSVFKGKEIIWESEE